MEPEKPPNCGADLKPEILGGLFRRITVTDLIGALKGATAFLEKGSVECRCSRCQTPLESKQAFCPGCGDVLRFECPRCRGKCLQGHGFCAACGFKLTQESIAHFTVAKAREEGEKLHKAVDLLQPFTDVERMSEGRYLKLRARRRDTGEPAEQETFARERQLRKRLQRVPRSWVTPRDPGDHEIDADRGSPLRVWIVPRQQGILERVRCSNQTLGFRLLLNEFEALQAVQHENVVALRWARRCQGCLWVATSWREIDRGEPAPYPLRWLLHRMAEAARGVAAIHRAGLVHGDLKPATILMGESWTLVSDLKGATPPGRRTRALFTPKFAAPEQVLGEHVGPAADLYALGMTLYMLFVKDRFPLILRGAETAAVQSETVSEDEMPLLSAATAVEPWSVTEGRTPSSVHKPAPASGRGPDFLNGVKVRFRSQLSRVLERAQHAGWVGEILRIVRKATQLDPSERYTTCAEFGGAINDLLQRLPEEVRAAHPGEISQGTAS